MIVRGDRPVTLAAGNRRGPSLAFGVRLGVADSGGVRRGDGRKVTGSELYRRCRAVTRFSRSFRAETEPRVPRRNSNWRSIRRLLYYPAQLARPEGADAGWEKGRDAFTHGLRRGLLVMPPRWGSRGPSLAFGVRMGTTRRDR